MTSLNNYHKQYRRTSLSFLLLREAVKDDDVTVKENIIYVGGEPLVDKSGRKLLIFNNASKKTRRQNKDLFAYFDMYKHEEHYEIFEDLLYFYNKNFDCMNITYNEKGKIVQVEICEIVNSKVYNVNPQKSSSNARIQALLKWFGITIPREEYSMEGVSVLEIIDEPFITLFSLSKGLSFHECPDCQVHVSKDAKKLLEWMYQDDYVNYETILETLAEGDTHHDILLEHSSIIYDSENNVYYHVS